MSSICPTFRRNFSVSIPREFLPVYTCLYLSIPVYTCLYLSIPVYTCLYLSISVYTCLYLSIPVYTCLYLSIPITNKTAGLMRIPKSNRMFLFNNINTHRNSPCEVIVCPVTRMEKIILIEKEYNKEYLTLKLHKRKIIYFSIYALKLGLDNLKFENLHVY